jgi:hypothetical protein
MRRIGQPALEPDLDDLGAESRGIGLEGFAAVGVQTAGDDEVAAPR